MAIVYEIEGIISREDDSSYKPEIKIKKLYLPPIKIVQSQHTSIGMRINKKAWI